MVSRLLKLTLRGTAKTSTLALVRRVVRMVTPAASQRILHLQEKQVVKVERNPNEDRQSMRNRLSEKEKQLKIILDLATEIESRALKTKRNEEHEILLKCSEILQDYASELVKDIIG